MDYLRRSGSIMSVKIKEIFSFVSAGHAVTHDPSVQLGGASSWIQLDQCSHHPPLCGSLIEPKRWFLSEFGLLPGIFNFFRHNTLKPFFPFFLLHPKLVRRHWNVASRHVFSSPRPEQRLTFTFCPARHFHQESKNTEKPCDRSCFLD